jgi:uncharacterized membrane protein
MALTENRLTTGWGAKKFLVMVIVIQLAMVGLIGLASLGHDVPVLRQLVAFVYLTFIPGLVILRVLRMRDLGSIKTLVYSVGLSLAFVMFLGFFMNMLYPLIGITKPISTLPLVTTISTVVVILSAVAYWRDRGSPGFTTFTIGNLLSPPGLLLLLLPLLSVLGACLVNYYNDNRVLLGLIILIALIVTMVAFNKFIPRALYPMAVAMISLSLAWHISLIYPDLSGWDIQAEYYTQRSIILNSIWDPFIYSNLNSMLSITVLAPTYSLISGLDAIWIFKLVYAAVFSLVPLILFQMVRTHTNDKVAFFTTFVFMSMSVFFALMPNYARQQIAELFLTLSILVIMGERVTSPKSVFLLIVFSASLVVSHYGTSYIYLMILCVSLLLSYLLRYLMRRLDRTTGKTTAPAANPGQVRLASRLNLTYFTLVLVVCLAWYMYIGSSAPLESALRVGRHIYLGIRDMFFVAETREELTLLAVGLAKPATISLWRYIYVYLQYAVQFFIVVGVAQLLLNLKKSRISPEYMAISMACLFLLLMCIILPYFAAALDISRIYHISLIVLSPFCILGGMTVFDRLLRLIRISSLRKVTESVCLGLVVMVVLIPYFLLSTGFVYELTDDVPTSVALSNYKMDQPAFLEPEMHARRWFLDMSPADSEIIGDKYAEACLVQAFPAKRRGGLPENVMKTPPGSYIFFRRWNIINNGILQFQSVGTRLFLGYVPLEGNPDFAYVLSNRSKIYDSGSAWIYGPKEVP